MKTAMLRAFLACVLALLACQGAAARPLTARDLATLDRVGEPELSPDGRWLAYAVRSTDWEGNKGVSALWMLDRKAPSMPPRRLEVSDKEASGPRWSPDGRYLYYLSSRSGSAQVWRTDADGAMAVQVTSLPVGVGGFRLDPSGRILVLALNVFPDCATLACTKARADARKASGVSAIVVDRLPMFIWDNWQSGERAQLFAVRLDSTGVASGEPAPLMKAFDAEAPGKPFGDATDFAVTPREIIFSALEPGRAWGVDDHYKLYAAPLDGSAPPHRLEADASGSYGKPTLSPDGARLAFLAAKAGSEDMRAAIMVRDLATGAEQEVDPGLDRSASALAWSPDSKTLYATIGDEGRARLFAVDVAARVARPLTATGEVSGVSAAADRVVIARASLGGPAQLYEIGKAGERPLTHVDAEKLAGVTLSPYEPFSFAGWNGEAVHGWVMRPQGYEPGRKYPVAFLIHGGPHGSFGDAWSYRWNPQVWAGMGFAVVMIDFHGSSGYGEAFARSIVGHWGDRPLEDLQKGWTAALAKYPYLDGDRACALGGSYGGYMVAWIAGAWNGPWKCLVDHDGVFDTRSMALTTDIPGFSEYETDGLVWENAQAYERFNPLAKVASWSKPILVIHGGKDLRVPLGQGLGAFTAAQRRGVPSKLVYFPDENHWVLKPQNSVEWYRNVEDWMRRWIGP